MNPSPKERSKLTPTPSPCYSHCRPSHFHYFSISRVQPTIPSKQEWVLYDVSDLFSRRPIATMNHDLITPHGGYRELKSFSAC